MAELKPRHGFEWSRVRWGGPRDPVAMSCSYCGAPFPEDHAPLRFFSIKGAACAFCEACMQRWWGFEPMPKEDGDVEDDG